MEKSDGTRLNPLEISEESPSRDVKPSGGSLRLEESVTVAREWSDSTCRHIPHVTC